MQKLIVKILAAYLYRRWRGSYRLTRLLAARFRFLQSLPVETENGTIVLDLRIGSAHGILAGNMSYTGEKDVIKRFVREGDVAFDIGAHLGLYTLPMSNSVGKGGSVYAFEPNHELLPSLRKTVSSLENVELLPLALSDKAGVVDLFVPEDASMASLSDWTEGMGVYKTRCEMATLDDLLEQGKIRRPQFIKCDVEGAEFGVFNGGRSMLNREDAPILMFELNKQAAKSFGKSTGDYFDLLESLDKPGYRFYEVRGSGIEELRSRDIPYTNVLAIPRITFQKL